MAVKKGQNCIHVVIECPLVAHTTFVFIITTEVFSAMGLSKVYLLWNAQPKIQILTNSNIQYPLCHTIHWTHTIHPFGDNSILTLGHGYRAFSNSIFTSICQMRPTPLWSWIWISYNSMKKFCNFLTYVLSFCEFIVSSFSDGSVNVFLLKDIRCLLPRNRAEMNKKSQLGESTSLILRGA